MFTLTFCFLIVSYVINTLGITTFNIHTQEAISTVENNFLSVCIDCVLDSKWEQFDFNSPLVNTLSKGLSPSYLRFSGTATDRTFYITPNNSNHHVTRAPSGGNITQTINMTQLSILTTFASNNNWSVIFGINAQDRFKNNSWDPTNTIQLLDYIYNTDNNNNIKNNIIAFEFGNEPDLYNDSKSISNGFVTVSPSQTAEDYNSFYNILQSKLSHDQLSIIPDIYGCDVTYHALQNYLKPFLNEMKKQNNYNKILNRITFHHYYGNGGNHTYPGINDFISVNRLDSLIKHINDSIQIRNEYDTNIPILLGESGPWSGDNANGGNIYVPTYIAGFMWLDQLSLGLSLGLSNIIREAFWTGTNSIINPKTYEPRPDYWNSYLFKNLVGNKALLVNNEFDLGRYIRLYSFCTRTMEQGSIYNYSSGSITIVVLNMYNSTQIISLNLFGVSNDIENMRYDEFHLLGKDGNVTSNDIYLNGKVIKMINQTSLPDLEPKQFNYGSNVTLHALSYSFIVVVNANASACIQ